MEYNEFKKYTEISGKEYAFVKAFKDKEGNSLVVEPSFYYGLENVKLRRPEVIDSIMDEIDRLLKQHKKLDLTCSFENPFFNDDTFIYKELEDILNILGIYFEDKSRGSDYGD